MTPIRLQLSAEQSRHLRRAGTVFVAIGPGSYPCGLHEIIYLIPSTVERVNAAVRVAKGEATARRKPVRRV